MRAYYKHDLIICGLRASEMSLTMRNNTLDIGTFSDPLASIALPPTCTAVFKFNYLRESEIDIVHQKFEIGSGTSFTGHNLGPADVCSACGTAWLPGTLTCPSCGHFTDHAERAIEYASRNAGMIVQTQLHCPLDGPVSFKVEVEFSELWLERDITKTFRHSLWSTEPALWVCKFCGHMVHGWTSDCPGCGGKRRPLEALATQWRECLYCGKQIRGGYACPNCNMRLKARDKLPEWTFAGKLAN